MAAPAIGPEKEDGVSLIQVKLIEGVFTGPQKREIVERLSEALIEIAGESMRGFTWCIVEEVASGEWGIGGQTGGLMSPAFANCTDPASGRTLVAAAAPVTAGMRLPKWRAAMVRAAPDVCSDSTSAKQTTLGGEPALAWTATCADGYHVSKIAALHGRRGYIILLASQTGSNDAAPRGNFDSIRGSFRFTR